MWRDVTSLPIEDLDLLQQAGLLWYKMEDLERFYIEDETPSVALSGGGWERNDAGVIWWKTDHGDPFKWHIREEGAR